MNDRVVFFDTTLRDGEQSPGVSLNIEEKLEIANQLARLQVDVIEAGFPITSRGDFEAVKAIAAQVKGPTIAALARASRGDIERAGEALKPAAKPRIHTFIATSDIHLKHKLKKTREEVLELAVAAVTLAKRYTPDVEFSAEDAFRSDLDYLCRVVEAVIDAGAVTVNLPDTVGYATPQEFGEFIAAVRSRVKNIDKCVLSVHCHNDLGLAVANSLAAVANGVQQVECAVNGIGERAGNAALEEIAMALYTRKSVYGKELGLNLPELYRTSRLVSTLTGMPVQPNKAVVGKNAFAHESGIHQDGVLKERTTYEIMNPALIGLHQNNIVLGKHSGRHAFRERLAELGYDLGDAELDKAFVRFKALADKKKEITDQDLEAIVSDEIRNLPERYQLHYLHISSGTSVVPTATVGLKVGDEILEDAACGSGPVDASYNAIEKLTRIGATLTDYAINSIGKGKDAQGEVTIRLEWANRTFIGRGVSTDVIEASVLAYISGINKVVHQIEKDRAANGNGSSLRERV
jgi:2-isopropylmalate synthase